MSKGRVFVRGAHLLVLVAAAFAARRLPAALAQQPVPPAVPEPRSPPSVDTVSTHSGGNAPAAPAGAGASDARVADANADRVLLFPTAYTHPKGTVFFSSLEIAFLQIGYAFSDDTQVTFSTVPTYSTGIAPLDLSLKTVVARQGRVLVAALGSVTGLIGLDDGFIFAGRAGGVAQLCLEDRCASSLNIGANVLFLGPVILAVTTVGAILQISNTVALLLEVDTLVPVGREVGQINAIALGAGIRFLRTRWSIDLGMIGTPDVASAATPAIPILAATYRFL